MVDANIGREPAVPVSKRIDILLVEYAQLREEIRLFTLQQRRYVNTYGAIVLSAFVAADYYHVILAFVGIPILSLGLITFVLADFFLVVGIGVRIRHIENEIATMNGGHAIIQWDTVYVPRILTMAPILRIQRHGGDIARFPNFFWPANLFIFLVLVSVSVIAVWQAQYAITNFTWYVVYTCLMIISHSILCAYFVVLPRAVYALNSVKHISWIQPDSK